MSKEKLAVVIMKWLLRPSVKKVLKKLDDNPEMQKAIKDYQYHHQKVYEMMRDYEKETGKPYGEGPYDFDQTLEEKAAYRIWLKKEELKERENPTSLDDLKALGKYEEMEEKNRDPNTTDKEREQMLKELGYGSGDDKEN